MTKTPGPVMNVAGVDVSVAQLQMRGYYVCPIPLRPGSVVEPGNYGRIVRHHGQEHHLWGREELLERVRQADFPTKPSRLTSAYYCPEVADAQWFQNHHSNAGIIYLVVPLSPEAPRHAGYMNCLPPIAGRDGEDIARRYWAADLKVQGPDGYPAQEIVIASPMLIVQDVSAMLAEHTAG